MEQGRDLKGTRKSYQAQVIVLHKRMTKERVEEKTRDARRSREDRDTSAMTCMRNLVRRMEAGQEVPTLR